MVVAREDGVWVILTTPLKVRFKTKKICCGE